MGLVAIEVSTGELRRLTKPGQENWGDVDPAVAPDGASVVFARDLGSTSELYRLKLKPDFQPDGEPEELTAHHRWTGMPAFTPTGRAVVYSSGIKDDVASLWLLPLVPTVGQSRLAPSLDQLVLSTGIVTPAQPTGFFRWQNLSRGYLETRPHV